MRNEGEQGKQMAISSISDYVLGSFTFQFDLSWSCLVPKVTKLPSTPGVVAHAFNLRTQGGNGRQF